MGELRIKSKEKLADTETPVSAYLKLCRGKPDSFLLESVETKDVTGRYSVVGFDPIFSLELHEDEVVVRESSRVERSPARDFFNLIRGRLRVLDGVSLPRLPAVGALTGFIGYDAVRLIEQLPRVRSPWSPLARLVHPSRFLIFDHLRRTMILLALGGDDASCSEKIRDMERALDGALTLPTGGKGIGLTAPPRERFLESVDKAREYIRAGDVFQVVLSDSFSGETDIDPFETYRRLRVRSPSPYMFFLDFGDYRLVGSSPETLVKVGDGTVTINPIAGTRGRSDDPREDRVLEKDLLESEKERAEHVMLVDLARNDAGRVCKYGSIETDPYMTIERYSHVMHIVSRVRGALKEGSDAVDAFIAAFPAGTVSGAPKVRAMEIIDELEFESRGPYAGAVGYFGPHNVMDTCIAIRTILFHEDRFAVRVGAGIVADSIPEMEYEEIENKAAQSLRALETAAKGES
jgi:anthranilate synthase component 1